MNALNLTEKEMEALAEVGNIGVGNASTALSRLLNKKVEIKLYSTEFIPIEKFAEKVGGADRISVTSYFQITCDLNGESIFIFPRDSAILLVDLLLERKPGQTKILESIEESAFKEMANIFIGSYLNAMAKMFDMKVIHSVPHVAVDMTQAIIDFMLIKLARKADNMLFVNTTIDIEGNNINGTFVILFEEESLIRIIDILHQRYCL